MRDSTPELKALLLARMPELAAKLGPKGYRAGPYWMTVSLASKSGQPGGMFITVSGPKAGAWVDAAGDAKGDVFGLIKYLNGFSTIKEAFAWAKHWVGWANIGPEELVKVKQQDEVRSLKLAREEQMRLEKARGQAFAIWLKADPSLIDTVAETYLATRGIDLAHLGKSPGALRFMPHAWHGESKESWPAIVAGMYDYNGRLSAIHRTFLARDGSGKAPVEPARKIWPTFKGLIIPINKGETGLSLAHAFAKGKKDRLAIVEGIEDGLSLAMACPELRIWAAGTLGNLQSIKPAATASEVIICADNDWGKPQAAVQLARAVEAMSRSKIPVRIARSNMGKDFNDALRGAA